MNEIPTPGPQARPRTTTYIAPRRTIRLTLPDGWARVGLSAIEVILLAWAAATIASAAAFATVASNPWMGETTWDQALRAGSDLLAIILGAPLHIGGVAYRATPTLVGVLLILVMRLLLRQSRRFSAASQWCAVPAFAIVALLIVGASAEHAHWWQAAPGALLIPGIAAAWAASDLSEDPWGALRIPSLVREGLKSGALLLLSLLGLSAVLTILALATHWARIRDIHELLLADSMPADILIVLAQVLYLPSILAWALAWILGPGVHVGVDALHSPASAPTLPIPGIPVLGALPSSAPGYWTILVPILLGVGVGAWWGRRRTRETLREQSLVAASGIGLLTLVGLAWFASSIMVLGDARLVHVGPALLPALFSLIAEAGGGLLAGQAAVHPQTVHWARTQWAISRGEPVPDEAVAPLPPDEPVAPLPPDEAGPPLPDEETGPRDDADPGEAEPGEAWAAPDPEDHPEDSRPFAPSPHPASAPDGGDAAAPGTSTPDTGAADAPEEDRPAPTAPIPVSIEELLGTSEHVVPAVKSPAEQAAQTMELAALPEDAAPEGTGARSDQTEADTRPIPAETAREGAPIEGETAPARTADSPTASDQDEERR